jgi:hypothetical protein
MSINYGAVIGPNVVTVLDPVYSKQLLGWTPEGLVVPELLPKLPSETYNIRLEKQNAPIQMHSNISLGDDGFPRINFSFTADTQVTMIPRGLTCKLTAADIEHLGGHASAQAKTQAILANNVAVSREAIFVASATSTTIQTKYTNVPTLWSDPNADILTDITNAIVAVREGIGTSAGCGFEPTDVVVPWHVFQYLRTHPQLVKAWLYRVGGNPNMKLQQSDMAILFGIDSIFIPKGMYYTNAVGAAQTLGDIWGKNVVIAKIDRTPNPNKAAQTWAGSYVPDAGGMADGSNPPAEFAYTWATPGVLEQFGYNSTSGYVAADYLIDPNSAILLPNVM